MIGRWHGAGCRIGKHLSRSSVAAAIWRPASKNKFGVGRAFALRSAIGTKSCAAGSRGRIPSGIALAGMLRRLRIRLFGGQGGFGIQPNQRGLIDRALIASVGFIGVPFVLLAALGTYQYHYRRCFGGHISRAEADYALVPDFIADLQFV